MGPGDVFVCPPGHDAWFVGDEQVVVYDFAGGVATDYVKAKDAWALTGRPDTLRFPGVGHPGGRAPVRPR